MQPFLGRGLLFLLRHGATEWNGDGRVMGRLPIPLSPDGARQVRGLAAHLAGTGITAVWTSPLLRARETAEIVATGLGGLPVHEDEGLVEVDYGAWQGRTFREVVRDPAFAELQRDPAGRAAPGASESLLDVARRVHDAMARICEAQAGSPALVVSHGDPLRIVLAGCLRLDLAELRRLRIDNGALSAVELTGDWAEVKFVNVRPDVSSMVRIDRHGRTERETASVRTVPVQGGG
jgi:broad specificity phosphatase PhoE